MPDTVASEPIPLRLAHRIDGRARLTAPAHIGERELRARAARLTAAGHARAEVRGSSVILVHDGAWPALGAALEEAGFILSARPPIDPIGKTNAAIAHLNATIGQASDGRMDLTNAAFMGLIAAGFVQMARGRFAGPAFTLFSQALTLAVLHAKSLDR